MIIVKKIDNLFNNFSLSTKKKKKNHLFVISDDKILNKVNIQRFGLT